MSRKRDVDIGRVFRHKERHVNVGKGMQIKGIKYGHREGYRHTERRFGTAKVMQVHRMTCRRRKRQVDIRKIRKCKERNVAIGNTRRTRKRINSHGVSIAKPQEKWPNNI